MDYIKKHDYLVCIDSDGTAIDSMNIKHKKCFGPCFAKDFGLSKIEDEALAYWDNVNLFSGTRGKNRFITLLLCLEHFNKKGIIDYDLAAFSSWVNNASELSNSSLKTEIEKSNDIVLNKALDWSNNVNAEIKKLTIEDTAAFFGVKEFLSYVKDYADVAVVSSANLTAVQSEWSHFELLPFVDAVATQEIGSKKACIEKLLEKGYDKSKVLMIGDAPPDLDAALSCGVLFYPIITGAEKGCWEELKNQYFVDIVNGLYNQDEQITKFESNFNKG